MIGILFAILSALFFACGDIGKKKLSAVTHPYLVNWIPVTFGVVLGGFVFAVLEPPVVKGGSLLPLAALCGVLLFFIELAFVRAIRDSEISLVMPLTALVPIVSGVIAWGAHDEAPTPSALIGIAIIVAASWLMFADIRELTKILLPFQRMLADSGARFMILFSVLYGVLVNLMNSGGDRSSGIYFLWLVLIAEWLVLSAAMLTRRLNPLPAICANKRTTLLTGTCWALGMGFFFESLSHTLISYAMAAKCTHTIFIVILGYLIFHDNDFRKRLGASILLFAGLSILFLGH